MHTPTACTHKPTGNAQVIGDLDFSGDSTNLYIGDGGGTHPGTTMCDAVVKFDVTKTGTNVAPIWICSSHDDTVRSVVWTSSAIYAAGHIRYLAQGSAFVPRLGIGAIDPATGQALSWNPGHDREIGSQELIVTNGANEPGQPTGLWVGSDSGGCGKNAGETLGHQGLCFFPVP